jgi:hypothetical protein
MTGLVDAYDEHELPTASEAIIALPGETLDSHIQTLSKLLDTGTESVTTYNLMLLNGTELTLKSTREKYGIKSHYRIIPRDFGKFSDGTISAEVEEIVTSTNAMALDEYIEGRLYHLLISTIWNNGIYDQMFKFMQNKNVSAINFFTYLKDNYTKGPSSFMNFVGSFLKDTREELWDKKDALIDHIKIEENYEKLVQGKLGHNLLQTYNAKWMTKVHEWNNFFCETFKYIIDYKNLKVEEQKFVDELKNYCVSKIHNIWGDDRDNDNPCLEFNYNIIDWTYHSKKDNEIKIVDVKFEKPKKIEFKLSHQQHLDIKNNLDRYGKTPTGIGRTVIKMGDPRSVLRKPSIVA